MSDEHYRYEIESDGVREVNLKTSIYDINVFMFWEFFDLRKETPSIVGLWMNRNKTKEERLHSFMRTKKWIEENHSDLLL
jgi:hypothetical protein